MSTTPAPPAKESGVKESKKVSKEEAEKIKESKKVSKEEAEKIKDDLERVSMGIPPSRDPKRFPDDPDEIDKYLNQIPLFAKVRPRKEDQGDAWKMIEAIEAGQDPKEKAKNCKQNGNDCYKAGKRRWNDALTFYQQALDCECGDLRLESQVYSNRALIHHHRQNYGRAIDDCKEALKLNHKNSKAYCRAGQASEALGKPKEAMKWYEHALKWAKDDFLKRNYVANLIKKLEISMEKKKESERVKAMKKDADRKFADLLAESIKLRKIRTTVDTLSGDHKPMLDKNGCLHWPVVFMYPEFYVTDFVQDMHELRSFKEQLGQMFPPKGTQPQWDKKKHYTIKNIAVYVEVENGGKPHSVREINMEDPLAEALIQKGVVVGGVPTFMILSKASDYMQHFKSTHTVV